MTARLLKGFVLAILVLAGGSSLAAKDDSTGFTGDRPRLGLMTTLPIYWGEAGELSELLDGAARLHWARVRLEQQYELVPLDVLDRDEGGLGGLDYLLMAQPRALAPAENLALDEWVKAGGTLLLFADPMLTGDSRFSIGDRRRPQDVALLSPILDHWGITFSYPADQPPGEYAVRGSNGIIPVNQAGRLALGTRSDDSTPDCVLDMDDVFASCAIGAGRALVFADAALFDEGLLPLSLRMQAFESLRFQAFAPSLEELARIGKRTVTPPAGTGH